MKQIDKRGNRLIKILCEDCGWFKWIVPSAIKKYESCPRCFGEPHKPQDIVNVCEIQEIVIEERQQETEVIKKKPKKNNNK